jgi:hypothetical protein
MASSTLVQTGEQESWQREDLAGAVCAQALRHHMLNEKKAVTAIGTWI